MNLTHLWFAFLAILLTVCSLILLRHIFVLYGAVIVKGSIQFVQSLSLDEEPALQLLHRNRQNVFYVLSCNSRYILCSNVEHNC